MEVQAYALAQAKRMLGDSGLAEMIIVSEGGFEMPYKSLDMSAIASNTSHAQPHSSKPVDNPRFYRFLADALETVILVGGGGYDYKVRFKPRRFTMDERAVEKFSRGWASLSGR
ncbi:MAG: hypothetical protein ABIA12_02800 [Candidatus Aenigmatarchaeota archaeon]